MPDASTRERLLDAAWAEAVEVGIERLTLAAVGARAGVSRQAVYLHFGNRATLLVQMTARFDHTSGFRARLAESRRAAPRESFRIMLNAWFDYVPTILPVSLALEAAWLTGGDGAEAYRDRMDDWHEGIRVAVRRLADAGALAAGWTVATATDWTWACVHPTHLHHLTRERGWSHTSVRRRVIRALQAQLVDGPRS
jgi:AcrR family transcriptional regulator